MGSLYIVRAVCPRFLTGEKYLTTRSVNSSSVSKDICQTPSLMKGSWIPLATIVKPIRLAQYSWLHHSRSRRLVSRPTVPPSGSVSELVEISEGFGEALLDGSGDGSFESLGLKRDVLDCRALESFKVLLPLNAFAAAVRDSIFPLPNFLQGWPSLLRYFESWNIRH